MDFGTLVFWGVIVIILLVLLFAPIPKKFRNRPAKPYNKRKYPTSGALMGVINEAFQPSAKNATVVQEEQREARKATPAPEDKLKPWQE